MKYLNMKTSITAHRGASGSAPENTLTAITKAISAGAEYAEVDVQETADGRIVLLHDEDLKRTTGFRKHIWETNFNELSDLEAGSWFDEQFRGEKIPTLEEAIAVCRDKIILNIELKSNGYEEKLAERVVEIVKSERFEKSAVITSFELSLIDTVKKIAPEIKTGLIFYFMPSFDIFSMSHPVLSVHKRNVTKKFINKAVNNGKEVHVWTVNDAPDMEELLELQVDNIITNYPEMVYKLREAKTKGRLS